MEAVQAVDDVDARIGQRQGLRDTAARDRQHAGRELWYYAEALYLDDGATVDDLREAVETLADAERTARQVLGGAHPDAVGIESSLRNAREALCARTE